MLNKTEGYRRIAQKWWGFCCSDRGDLILGIIRHGRRTTMPGFAVVKYSPWGLSCHFLVVLSNRADSLWEQLLGHNFRGSDTTCLERQHSWQSETAPPRYRRRKGSPCLHKHGQESCPVNKHIQVPLQALSSFPVLIWWKDFPNVLLQH